MDMYSVQGLKDISTTEAANSSAFENMDVKSWKKDLEIIIVQLVFETLGISEIDRWILQRWYIASLNFLMQYFLP